MKIEGLKGLEEVLTSLPRKVARPAVLAAAREAVKPLVEDLRVTAARDTGRSAETITARTVKVDGFEETVAVGPTRAGFPLMLREFGTARQPARPWMRPAWDSHKETVLQRFRGAMWARIMRAAARHAEKIAEAGE